MFISAAEVRINSSGERFGFRCDFKSGLNVIRGNNSSGKSTLVNTLMYGLGLEEVVGMKGERALTSAVRDSFQFDGGVRQIDESAVLVEVRNAAGRTVTFRRPIKNADKSTKLVEVFDGALLTDNTIVARTPVSLFLHDGGAAQDEQGFLNYFERFIGMQLPRVQSSTGGLTRLYPQVIAAALFIEQKRGWTDYIANIPFYQILSAPTRVVQYLLGLDNFQLEEDRARNQQLISALQFQWANAYSDLHGSLRSTGVSSKGISKTLSKEFKAENASLWVQFNGAEVLLQEAISAKLKEWHEIDAKRRAGPTSESPDVIRLLESETSKLERSMTQYEEMATEVRLRKATLSELRELLLEAEVDLKKNKTTRKLRVLGAAMELATAKEECPTCGSAMTTLAGRAEGIQPMDLDSNVEYLEAQVRMLGRQIAGLSSDLEQSGAVLKQLEAVISEQRAYVISIRRSTSQSDAVLEASVRKQITLEREIREYEAAQTRLSTFLDEGTELARRLGLAEQAKQNFPRDLYSQRDRTKISILEKHFRANASSFEYSSAIPTEIRINPETLLPALDDLTLRQVKRRDMKWESSASDFVRLIWAYLIAIYQTSNQRDFTGNHPGVLLFDEPGQHSMSTNSQKALMQIFSGEKQLQSIVAASFEDSDLVFEEVTEGSKFHLIRLPQKVVGPLAHDGVM
ncbi:AAA family ATPase [Burkholderia thailandensis]|uniref:AAA family ATPase n=3 Tax=Burkholderia thailandensis TaxID=57975 RepID=UPI00217E5F4F|nr:AAA family ATPase [Burkholderia thailandensis]MCS6503538.1 AAA family ATPase [Burkholderia thailandensis]